MMPILGRRLSTNLFERKMVTVDQILEDCLEKATKDRHQQDKNRVARCLKALKWERYQKRLENGTREWRYRKTPVSPEELDEW
jgi:hypothetical protein